MNLLNLPDWNIEHVEDSARDYRVHATYGPEPGQCIHCGKGQLFAGKLKEDFYDLWAIPQKSDAKAAYKAWRDSIKGTELLTAFQPLLTAMHNWETPIFAYWDHRATNALTEALNGVTKLMQRQGRGYSFEAIRAKMLYSPTLQKQPQHRQARYGENFHRAVPPPPLGTDVDALLLMLEAEERQ